MEKFIRENEMQIKILNELREKDTKQHIKALTDLDSQFKKKSSDADKVNHLYDQIRAKQERIQELESQLARVEKQSNQERQTFEKQAHENWLNARKFEKELKDSKNELSNLREKFNDLLNEANSLKQKSASFNFYTSPSHYQPQLDTSLNNGLDQNTSVNLSEPNVDQPLQIDTNNRSDSRPSSATSSNSGINSGIGGPLIPPIPPAYSYMRPQFRYPFPIPSMAGYIDPRISSPNPDMALQAPRMRMPFGFPSAAFQQSAHNQMMYKMMMQQSKSASSSQQPSPGGI